MEEKDSDYFFGRTRETVATLEALEALGRLPVLIGNSGVGKSSVAQAGVLAALKRQAWPDDAQAPRPWPAVFQNSRQWCFLTLKPGADPIKALVDCFLDAWQFEATDPKRVARQHDWIDELLHGKATLSDLIEATERRRVELGQPKPPAFLLYVDQGEELYARAAEPERRRFSELLAAGAARPAPARDDEHALRLLWVPATRHAFVQGPPADRRAAARRGGIARGGEPAGETARGPLRERPARRHHR